MGVRLLVLRLGPLLVAFELAQASGGIQLIGGCDTPGEAISVAVSGDYAYVADGYSGLRIISIADPAHPVEVGHFDTPGWACGVAVDGDRLYVADDTAGLRIISVADPAHPVEVGHFDTQDRAWGVAVRGDTAHVASIDFGFAIISAVDPTNPAVVGGFYQFNSRTLGGVAVSENCAYVTHDALGLLVISITPCELVGYCGAYTRAGGVAASHGYVYVAADEDGLHAISVADPTHPVLVGTYDAPNWWANGVTTAGGYVYVAYGMAGLQIFQELGGVEEGSKPQAASYKPAKSVVRGLQHGPVAFDAMGRRVATARPGVYFLREAQEQAVRKVVVTR